MELLFKVIYKRNKFSGKLTFNNNNIECACSNVAGAVGEHVGDGGRSDGEEITGCAGSGAQRSRARVVGSGWLRPRYRRAADSAVYRCGHVVDAGNDWRDSVDCGQNDVVMDFFVKVKKWQIA